MDAPTHERLARDGVVPSLLGRLLYRGPNADLLASLAASRILSHVPLADAAPGAREGAELLEAWAQRNAGGVPAEECDRVCDDHVQLFIGPGKLGAPPWESIYGDGDRDQVLWTVSTLSVRHWYLRHGFDRTSDFHEPEDHVGLELEFVSLLATRAADALQHGHEDAAAEAVAAMRGFLLEHVVVWVPKWCAAVVRHARTDFYRGVALTVNAVVEDLDAHHDVRGQMRSAKGRDAGQLETPGSLLPLTFDKGRLP